jgi:hypothetical protein
MHQGAYIEFAVGTSLLFLKDFSSWKWRHDVNCERSVSGRIPLSTAARERTLELSVESIRV